MRKSNQPITYRDAGVDIDSGNRLVERIGPIAARTRRPEVLTGIGGFGALFELPVDRYERPVLVSGTDGVGTKLRLAIEHDRHDTIGIDLVGMCVNDVLVTGAEPLFFLDYYATGKLDEDVAATVVDGIARGCELAGAALVGGETAEMPGMYSGADYDLAGFCVGVVERDRIIDGRGIVPGTSLIALASSGPHSNGYSLIRKLVETSGVDVNAPLDGEPLLDLLLAPTRIYVRSVLELIRRVDVLGMAHITGGGILENVPRMLPDGLCAEIDLDTWDRSAVFRWLRTNAGLDDTEMYKTFNCGVGMVICVAAQNAREAIAVLETSGEQAFEIGVIARSDDGERVRLQGGKGP